MKKIRVLIVEDSPVIRQFLEHIIARDPRLEIAGAVETGEEALRVLHRVAPDVISMDIRLPGMNGFEATKQIMREKPTPVVVVSASVERDELHTAMNALRAGALAVVEKPSGGASDQYEALAERLCTQLAIMSQVKVVRRHTETGRTRATGERAAARLASYKAMGVVSSTGGPGALVRLLGLGAKFPLPILVVQHIAASFLEDFASWLASECPFAVEIVKDRVRSEPGRVYLAEADHHLCCEDGFVRTGRGLPVCAQRPSGTVLFESMAALGSQALGVLLTGMGDDGAAGLLRLREQGGYTIAEDESTAVVYGMPAEAVRLGAVAESLPLPAIAPRILQLLEPQRQAA